MSVPLDQFRLETLARLSGVASFRNTWPHLQKEIYRHLGDDPNGESLYDLGNKLSGIFLSVTASKASAAEELAREVLGLEPANELAAPLSTNSPTSTRTQSDVSSGGVVWECLVTWYLNLVCHGTDLIAAKRTKANTPGVITDAISVTLHGYATTSESDVVVYSAPGVLPNGKGRISIREIDAHIKADTQACSVAIVQCKTNWNDNAQIPMLWDLVYRSLPFVQVSSIHLGRKGVTPRSFKGESIKYAFVTVPTNQNAKYTPGSVPVTRVLGLSGGNYWGKSTEQGVATGFSEFLNNNFSEYFAGSIANHINRQILANTDLLARFLDLKFD